MAKALFLALALLGAALAVVPAAEARYAYVEVCAGACTAVVLLDMCGTNPPDPVRTACSLSPCWQAPPDPVAPACAALSDPCRGLGEVCPVLPGGRCVSPSAGGLRASACVLARPVS